MTPDLAAAVAAVYDAHGTPAQSRIQIVWPMELSRARMVADIHASHDGDWVAGSCDAELFALEWEIYLAERPVPRPSLLDRLRAALGPKS